MKFLVTDIEFHFDKDEGNTICNSELDTFFIASESDRQEVRDRPVSYTHLTLPTICSV